MLQSKKDKLTVGILTRLKQKGPPRNEIPDQSLIGEESPPETPLPEDEADQTMNDIVTVPPSQGPRKRMRRVVPPQGY